MKYCTKCSSPLTEGSRFCNACGAEINDATAVQPARTDEELRAEEQAVLNKFSIALKHERLAWKISGIVWTIFTAIYAVIGVIIALFGIIGAAAGSGEMAALIFIGLLYGALGLLFLPLAIINFSMKKKVESYREKLYTDCTDGIGHFSVGSIVFCAFFNEVALIFNIVYFIQRKRNAAVIERIKARQASFNAQQ